ncbi:MAG: 23S rRNA (guanosine(2251)-2'-O)-methyltransferase RlmB [Clostridia bacterium]|nr:23S rRNA (guanosine(2251)-2'-O)-methyltransferase RlmB [Clostridia bacterium]
MTFLPERAERDTGIIAGRNAVSEALKSGREIENIMVAKGAGGSVLPLISQCKKRGIPVKEMPRQTLDQKLPGINHQGIAAVVSCAQYAELEDILKAAKDKGTNAFILILDELEDPHNLGAIIRTAEASSVDGIIIPKRRSAGLTQTVAKVASGALEYVPVARVSNICAAIDTLKENGIWVYGADMDGDTVYNTDLTGNIALVIGSEGRGISRLVKENCDFLVKLPMFGQINSLNASVAAGALMYETVRQRLQK